MRLPVGLLFAILASVAWSLLLCTTIPPVPAAILGLLGGAVFGLIGAEWDWRSWHR